MIPIFVVRYRNPEVEDRCIEAVRVYADPSEFELVVVDNGVADENLAVVWNRLIREWFEDNPVHAGPDMDPAFLLLNTDAFLDDPESLRILARTLRQSDQIAAVGPMTDNAGSVQATRHPFWQQRDRAGLGTPGGPYAGKVLIDHHISGFCLLVRLAAFEDVGGFREDCPFYGQESALIEAAWARGWNTVVCLDAFCEHLGGATAKKFRNQDEERQKGAAWFQRFRAELEGKK